MGSISRRPPAIIVFANIGSLLATGEPPTRRYERNRVSFPLKKKEEEEEEKKENGIGRCGEKFSVFFNVLVNEFRFVSFDFY